MMQLIRVVPKVIPEKRNYVVDQLDRVEIANYDMRFLSDIDDDLVMLEWDIAVAQHDLINFIGHCQMAPDLVHVAPYVLYPESLTDLEQPVWAHREVTNFMPLQTRWINYGDTICDLFSTGMIYLPVSILKRVSESDTVITWHSNMTDSKLAFWYYYTIGKKILVHWDVRPIHLHYDQESIYEYRGISRNNPGRHSLGALQSGG